MNPTLKLLLNKEFDKQICFDFMNFTAAGVDFGAGIIELHPHLSSIKARSEKIAKEIISAYFDKFYFEHQEKLEDVCKSANIEWVKKGEMFYKACDKYFENQAWPQGKYEVYISIINCNPRFLEDKTFQFYFDNPDKFIGVAIHEMLHFLFFELLFKLLPDKDPNDSKVWAISEVFNGLIMQEIEFVHLTSIQKPAQYPELKKTQEALEAVWDNNKNAKSFILSTLT